MILVGKDGTLPDGGETFSFPTIPSSGVRTEGVAENRGPRGGLIDNPTYAPEFRRAELNESQTGLHRFQDTTRQGIADAEAWHYMAAYMIVAGRTNSEIAMAAGKTVTAVSVLRGQHWFQQKLASIANSDGEAMMGAMRSHALAAIERIADLAENAEKDRDRLTANMYLVDQAVGKAVQKNLNLSASVSSGSAAEEYDRIQAELRDLRSRRSANEETPLP